MRIRAVVDQIEAGKALLLISPDEKSEIFWPVEHLPKGIKESDIVYIDINIDHTETKQTLDKVQQQIDFLVKRTQEMDKQKDKDSNK